MEAGLQPPPTYAQAVTGADPIKAVLPRPEITTYKGEIAIKFPQPLIDHLAKPFRYALVGKFSQGRPHVDLIRRFMNVQNFSEKYTMGLLDSKHVLFNFSSETDYNRLYSKGMWQVISKPMQILKWTTEFRADIESPIVPIWLSFPQLPAHLMDKDSLFDIVSSFGKPMRIDAATSDFRRPSVAKIQVEIDLLKPIPSRIWIQQGEGTGYWQTIDIEDVLPSYCIYCSHLGHDEHSCLIKHPELKITKSKPNTEQPGNTNEHSGRPGKPTQQYRILQRNVIMEQSSTALDTNKGLVGEQPEISQHAKQRSGKEKMIETQASGSRDKEIISNNFSQGHQPGTPAPNQNSPTAQHTPHQTPLGSNVRQTTTPATAPTVPERQTKSPIPGNNEHIFENRAAFDLFKSDTKSDQLT